MFGFVLVLLRFRFNVPVNNFLVMSGQSHCFMGVTVLFGKKMCLCSRTQHGGGRPLALESAAHVGKESLGQLR